MDLGGLFVHAPPDCIHIRVSGSLGLALGREMGCDRGVELRAEQGSSALGEGVGLNPEASLAANASFPSRIVLPS